MHYVSFVQIIAQYWLSVNRRYTVLIEEKYYKEILEGIGEILYYGV